MFEQFKNESIMCSCHDVHKVLLVDYMISTIIFTVNRPKHSVPKCENAQNMRERKKQSKTPRQHWVCLDPKIFALNDQVL